MKELFSAIKIRLSCFLYRVRIIWLIVVKQIDKETTLAAYGRFLPTFRAVMYHAYRKDRGKVVNHIYDRACKCLKSVNDDMFVWWILYEEYLSEEELKAFAETI